MKAYERIKSKETIVHYCQNLCLSMHPFVPWSTFVFFLSLPFACELAIKRWRIEVVEAQVGIQFLRFTDVLTEVVFIVMSDFILIEISFPIQ